MRSFVVQLPSTGVDRPVLPERLRWLLRLAQSKRGLPAAFSRGGAIGYSDLDAPGMQDLAWALDEGARLDFAYAANHQLAVAAKTIIAAYYGQPPAHSYFIGCSDGGREALMEAQRFPDDFDGIVADAPAYLLAFLNSYKHIWQYRANTDAKGDPIITAEKATVLHNAVLAACDSLDGVTDSLLFDPRDCTFDPATLLCSNQHGCAGLPDPGSRSNAAKQLYSAPVDVQGVRYYPGPTLPYGSELRWAGGGPPGGGSFDKMIADAYLSYLALPLPQQDTSLHADTLTFDPASYERLLAMASVYNASGADLSTFRDRGGKLILYHGWADDSISPTGTIAYYAALQQQMGGLEATQRFARLFMFPGVYHCSGGEGPSHWDMVNPITDWVKRGVTPDQIVATQYESDVSTAGGGCEDPTQIEASPTAAPGVPTAATPAGSGPTVRRACPKKLPPRCRSCGRCRPSPTRCRQGSPPAPATSIRRRTTCLCSWHLPPRTISTGSGKVRIATAPLSEQMIPATNEEKGSQHALAESSPAGLNTAHGAESRGGRAHLGCGAECGFPPLSEARRRPVQRQRSVS